MLSKKKVLSAVALGDEENGVRWTDVTVHPTCLLQLRCGAAGMCCDVPRLELLALEPSYLTFRLASRNFAFSVG